MKFESLKVWEKSKDLSVEVYRHFAESRDWGFRNQITRSVLSIASNIAEGSEKNTNKEKIQYLRISKASCSEFKAQTIIGAEIGYIDTKAAKGWMDKAEEIARMLAGFIRRLELEMEGCD